MQLSSELTKASPQSKLNDTIAALTDVLQSWQHEPSAAKTAVGLDSKSVSDRVAMEVKRLQQMLSSTKHVGITTLQKNVTAATNLLEGLNVDEEADFLRRMRANSSQMAKLQSSFQAARLALSLDGGKTYNPTGDGDDADEKAKELFDESIWLGAKAMYMVCVYTALTLHRSATTWANNKRGKTQKSSLKVVLRTLNTGEAHKVDEYFQHEIVNEMRRDAQVPRPPIASGQVPRPRQVPKAAKASGHVRDVEAETTGGKPTDPNASVPSLQELEAAAGGEDSLVCASVQELEGWTSVPRLEVVSLDTHSQAPGAAPATGPEADSPDPYQQEQKPEEEPPEVASVPGPGLGSLDPDSQLLVPGLTQGSAADQDSQPVVSAAEGSAADSADSGKRLRQEAAKAAAKAKRQPKRSGSQSEAAAKAAAKAKRQPKRKTAEASTLSLKQMFQKTA